MAYRVLDVYAAAVDDHVVGKPPSNIAGAAIYIAGQTVDGQTPTQAQVGAASDCVAVSIRSNAKNYIDAHATATETASEVAARAPTPSSGLLDFRLKPALTTSYYHHRSPTKPTLP